MSSKLAYMIPPHPILSLAHAVAWGITVLDGDLRYRYMNPYVLDVLGWDTWDGRHLADIGLSSADEAEYRREVLRILNAPPAPPVCRLTNVGYGLHYLEVGRLGDEHVMYFSVAVEGILAAQKEGDP